MIPAGSPAEELARYLAQERVAKGFGGNAEWSAHVSTEPERPDNVVTLYDTAGLDPLVVDGAFITQPGVLVRVRGNDYRACRAKQEAIRDLFLLPLAVDQGTPIERTIGGHRYLTVAPVADILSLGRDDANRHILVANYQVIRQPVENQS